MQITTIQSEAQSEKEDLVSRLVVIEHEKKRSDDELVTTEKKLKEAVKVCVPPIPASCDHMLHHVTTCYMM